MSTRACCNALGRLTCITAGREVVKDWTVSFTAQRAREGSMAALQHLIQRVDKHQDVSHATEVVLSAGVGETLRELLEPEELRAMSRMDRNATLGVLRNLCYSERAAEKMIQLVPQLVALLCDAPDDTTICQTVGAAPIINMVSQLGATALDALKKAGFFSCISLIEPISAHENAQAS